MKTATPFSLNLPGPPPCYDPDLHPGDRDKVFRTYHLRVAGRDHKFYTSSFSYALMLLEEKYADYDGGGNKVHDSARRNLSRLLSAGHDIEIVSIRPPLPEKC